MADTPVQISRPTVQYTTRAQPAFVQFQRLSPRDGQWKDEAFHPTQDELCTHEAAVNPVPPGYWGDAGVEGAARAYLAIEYGITDVVIFEPAQPGGSA